MFEHMIIMICRIELVFELNEIACGGHECSIVGATIKLMYLMKWLDCIHEEVFFW